MRARRTIGTLGADGRIRHAARTLGVVTVAVWLLAGCGNGKSPTESGRLAEGRVEAREIPKPGDVVDALYLGSGPLIPRDGFPECPFQGIWSGYPRGTTVRLRVSSRVPGQVQAGLAAAVDSLTAVTSGGLSVAVSVVPDSDPLPGANEVTVAEVAFPRSAGCSSDSGCVQYRFAGRGLLMGARVVAPPGRTMGAYLHDVVGHALLGLCHIDAKQIGGADASLMSAGLGTSPGAGAPTLTSLDLEAISAVYASAVNPGAPRSAFLAARLVNLQAGQLPRVP